MAVSTDTLATEIVLGGRVRTEFRVNPLGGPLADIDSVDLVIRAPGGTTTTAGAIEHPAVGIYSYDHIPTAVGRWWYSWRGADAGGTAVVREAQVIVKKRNVP